MSEPRRAREEGGGLPSQRRELGSRAARPREFQPEPCGGPTMGPDRVGGGPSEGRTEPETAIPGRELAKLESRHGGVFVPLGLVDHATAVALAHTEDTRLRLQGYLGGFKLDGGLLADELRKRVAQVPVPEPLQGIMGGPLLPFPRVLEFWALRPLLESLGYSVGRERRRVVLSTVHGRQVAAMSRAAFQAFESRVGLLRTDLFMALAESDDTSRRAAEERPQS